MELSKLKYIYKDNKMSLFLVTILVLDFRLVTTMSSCGLEGNINTGNYLMNPVSQNAKETIQQIGPASFNSCVLTT